MPKSNVESPAWGTVGHKMYVMKENVEQAKFLLEDEFKSYPHVKDNPLGHAGSSRKIFQYIDACIKDGVSCSECKENVYSILGKFGMDGKVEQCNFVTTLDKTHLPLKLVHIAP